MLLISKLAGVFDSLLDKSLAHPQLKGGVFRRSETLLAALVVVLLSAAGVGAQHESIIPTLTPVGSSRKPVLLNQRVPFIAPTYRSTSPNEIIAQLPGLPVTNWIPFREFMEKVEEANLTLTAQRYNVPIAGAQLTAASVYPNPTFEWEYGGDVSGNGQNSTYAGSLSQTVVLGGKIGASEEVASATLRASNALLSIISERCVGEPPTRSSMD